MASTHRIMIPEHPGEYDNRERKRVESRLLKEDTMGARFDLLIVILMAVAVLVIAPHDTAPAAAPAKAYFAGGCFWCMEEALEKIDGVTAVVSGYMGGTVANPNYEQVSAGQSGHAESVEVSYDPGKVSYQQILEVFWHNVDPVTPNAQFCDHGNQYRAAIFYGMEEEKRLAEA